jgi:putative inorganic carbon (HCO3(-)) transporter
MVLACCLFAALLSFSRSQGGWRLASAVSAGLASIGVLLSLTRSVWLGTLVGALVVMVIVPPLRRRIAALLAGAAATVGTLLLVVPGLSTTLVDRLTTERSVYDRQNVNAAAFRAIAAHPIDGVGWMQWLGQSTDWVRQSDSYPVTTVDIEIHNVVLSRAAELGLVGAGLWIACILAGPVLAMIRKPAEPALQGWRPVYVGYACVWGVCIMLSPVPYVLPNNLFWLIGGLLLKEHLTTTTPRSAPADRLVPA